MTNLLLVLILGKNVEYNFLERNGEALIIYDHELMAMNVP